MGVFEKLPYLNYHDINLDWLVRQTKKNASDNTYLMKIFKWFQDNGLVGVITDITENVDDTVKIDYAITETQTVDDFTVYDKTGTDNAISNAVADGLKSLSSLPAETNLLNTDLLLINRSGVAEAIAGDVVAKQSDMNTATSDISNLQTNKIDKSEVGILSKGSISLSGELSAIETWLAANFIANKNFEVIIIPTDSTGPFGNATLVVQAFMTSANYGFATIQSNDNSNNIILGKNNSGTWTWSNILTDADFTPAAVNVSPIASFSSSENSIAMSGKIVCGSLTLVNGSNAIPNGTQTIVTGLPAPKALSEFPTYVLNTGVIRTHINSSGEITMWWGGQIPANATVIIYVYYVAK